MGRSIALTLAREGAKVVVNYRRSEDAAKAIVDRIQSQGGSAVKVQADVFEAEDCKKLVDAGGGAVWSDRYLCDRSWRRLAP
jgi:NAD(P)-dependent dehydrogenase (short-subunit alcohol dehydrogenase family)